MKIIIIGTAYPYRGGLAAFNERLAREYSRQGHEVSVITFTLQYPSFLFPGKTQFSSEPAPTDLNIRRVVSSINPFNWIKTGRRLKKEKADLIIFAYWMSFFAPCFGTIARFARSPKTKLIALVHNMIPHEPTILDKIFPSCFVNSMNGFIAMSDAVVADINRFDKKHAPKLVSPHPIYDHYGDALTKEEAAKTLNFPPQEKYILFFGFIRRYKGLDLLLDAMANQQIRDLHIHLIVAGEFYEDSAFYLNKIRELHLEDSVTVKQEFIPDDEVRYYFSLADLIVQPYRSATQSGVSQIAYHFEKPMLVTNVGGLAEIVPDGKVGYAVDAEPEAIAHAIVDFYEHKRAAGFIKNIKEEKKKYLWSAMTASIRQLDKTNARKI